jgi:hypothetical protein
MPMVAVADPHYEPKGDRMQVEKLVGSVATDAGYFRAGTAKAQNPMAMLIVDLRQLELSAQQGNDLREKVNELILKELERMGIDLSARSSHDLSKSVLGFTIE